MFHIIIALGESEAGNHILRLTKQQNKRSSVKNRLNKIEKTNIASDFYFHLKIYSIHKSECH